MYKIEHSDVSRIEVLYRDGSHAWIICDDCNKKGNFYWDRYNVVVTYICMVEILSRTFAKHQCRQELEC